jgi:glycine/D-amino acid oxidase-like deaminating enzyme
MAKSVVIAGAGIIGAALAYYLTRAGAEVTVLDTEEGGNATTGSWGWLNANWGNPEPYFHLRHVSMGLWRELDRDVPDLVVDWCGGLMYDLAPEKLLEFAETYGRWGYGTRLVNRAEVIRLEPGLRLPPETAVHVAEEGMVESLAAAHTLMKAARDMGARVIHNVHVKWLEQTGDRVNAVITDAGTLAADEIVLAAGAGMPGILQTIGIGLKFSFPKGLLVHSLPAHRVLNGLVMAPGVHARQTAEGRLTAGVDFAGGNPGDDPTGTARALFRRLQDLVTGGDALAMDFYTVSAKPVPGDGFPAVGRPLGRQGLYVAMSHGGVTMAPIIGKVCADELLAGKREPLLDPFPLDRLLMG